MPFTSYEQESYLKHNHPEIYKRWLEKYGHFRGKKKKKKSKRKKKK